VVVARGAEGGGHGDPRIGTLPLLDGVLEAVSLPVLASGGISSPRGLAAVLAAGASGAWIGTAFAACPESLAPDAARQALVGADGTVVTRVFDLASGHGWPERYPERILATDLSDEWVGREAEVAGEVTVRAALAEVLGSERGTAGRVDAGQGVGMLTECRTADEVVRWLCSGAAALLAAWSP
jgi:nitronate monooxygenase